MEAAFSYFIGESVIDYWRLQNESQTPPYNLCKETAAVNIKEKLREIGIILVSAWRSLISLLFLGQALGLNLMSRHYICIII